VKEAHPWSPIELPRRGCLSGRARAPRTPSHLTQNPSPTQALARCPRPRGRQSRCPPHHQYPTPLHPHNCSLETHCGNPGWRPTSPWSVCTPHVEEIENPTWGGGLAGGTA